MMDYICMKNYDKNELLANCVCGKFEQLDVIKYLVEHKGADVNYIRWPCIFNESVLHLAAKNGKTEVVKYLVSKGAETNDLWCYFRTELFLAIERGHVETAKALIELGANAFSSKGEDLLSIALELHNNEMV